MRLKTAVWMCLTMSRIYGNVAQRASAQATSAPEERLKWAAITHQLETSPLDEGVNKDGDWALQRVTDVHDFHVSLCASLFTEFRNLQYTYQHAILRQYLLASAAFQIEDSHKARKLNATSLYAVVSVLKTYQAILAQKPEARSELLDSLLKEQTDGTLASAIDKQCK